MITTLHTLADRYDALLLDLWGVIHDGTALYPGVAEALAHLRTHGTAIVLLSNAPRRAAVAARTLERLGIGADQYDALLTSGELTHRYFAVLPVPVRYFFLGPPRDLPLLEDLPHTPVARPEDAELVLNVGAWDDYDPLEQYGPLLAQFQALRLPMVCANPDTLVVKQTGEQLICAGAIAARYAAMGGDVRWFGKPYGPTYSAAQEAIRHSGFTLDPARILAVGDNPDTDILGANRAGIASALVLGGVLAQEIGGGQVPSAQAALEECRRRGAAPDHLLVGFRWE